MRIYIYLRTHLSLVVLNLINYYNVIFITFFWRFFLHYEIQNENKKAKVKFKSKIISNTTAMCQLKVSKFQLL